MNVLNYSLLLKFTIFWKSERDVVVSKYFTDVFGKYNKLRKKKQLFMMRNNLNTFCMDKNIIKKETSKATWNIKEQGINKYNNKAQNALVVLNQI